MTRVRAFVLDSPLLMFHAGLLVLYPGVFTALLLAAAACLNPVVDMIALGWVAMRSLTYMDRLRRRFVGGTLQPVKPETLVPSAWIERLHTVPRQPWPVSLPRPYHLHAVRVKGLERPEAFTSPDANVSGNRIFVFMDAEPSAHDSWQRYSLLSAIAQAVVTSAWSIHRRVGELRWWVFACWTALLLGRADWNTVVVLVLAVLLQLIVHLHWIIAPGAMAQEEIADEFRVEYYVLSSLPRETLTAIAGDLRSGKGLAVRDLVTGCWLRALRHRIAQDLLTHGKAAVPAVAQPRKMRIEMINVVTAAVLLIVSQPVESWRSLVTLGVMAVLLAIGAIASSGTQELSGRLAAELER